MNQPIVVDLPHSLGAAEARRRIERNVHRLSDHIPGGATATPSWNGDRLTLAISAMGQNMTADIDVQETLVRFQVVLPPALAFFGGMLEPLIRRQGAQLLEDKRKKD
jgi:hypothetical protein